VGLVRARAGQVYQGSTSPEWTARDLDRRLSNLSSTFDLPIVPHPRAICSVLEMGGMTPLASR
jgi:prophage tail gpP-like protein